MKECTVCNKKKASIYRPHVKSVYSKKSYDILHCENCDHYFTDPVFSSQDLGDIYDNNYSYDAHSLIDKEKRMRANKYATFVAELPGIKNALEVGCMHGILLTELKKKGITVEGVELDPEAVKHCQKIGHKVVQSSVEDHLKLAGSKHDIIIMSHVIEHIADPQRQLESLSKRMHKQGKLMLITPNSNAPTRKLFGRYWGYWQVPVHINHFNEQSMKVLLKKSGFKIEKIKYYGGDSLFFLSSLANLLNSSNDSKYLSRPKKILVKIASFLLGYWYNFGKEDMLVIACKE